MTGEDSLSTTDRAMGWRAVRRDWAHFVRVRGESGPRAYLSVLWANHSLFALWIYRYGYWAYTRRSRWLSLPHKAVHRVLYLIGQVLCKIALDPAADIHDDVWLGPGGNILVGHHSRIGAGSALHGWNTLGLVAGLDVLPRLGDRVQLGHGAIVVGPVEVPDDTIIGPNTIIIRSIIESGAYTGAPARPFEGPVERLVPSGRTGRSVASRNNPT